MLERLKLRGVGPAPELEVSLEPRLNFITGDNGLGKTFLLDIAWWALTRSWARQVAWPQKNFASKARIAIDYRATPDTKPYRMETGFNRRDQRWTNDEPWRYRPGSAGIVIYAQLDGGFSVWDPARNNEIGPDRPDFTAFSFRPEEVWDGLPVDAAKKLCNGLIQDWAAWQREKGVPFDQLTRVLRRLSPSKDEILSPGELQRVSLDDVRDHPSVRTAYGQDVALIHASAGIRRIVALSYLLVWAWQEHLRACELTDTEPVSQLIFLIDEIEAHLHPHWQRRIVPTLLDVASELTDEHKFQVQFIAATHSPLVLASLEPSFDDTKDAIWELSLKNGHVELNRSEWRRYGDVNSWLSSSIFDLGEPRSLEAEEALRKARDLLRRSPRAALGEVLAVDRELRGVLGDVDRFWVRWSAFVEELRETE